MTTAEVFGAEAIPSSSGGAYRVVKTQEATECQTAAGGDVAAKLTAAGCTQVVRATLTSPDEAYVITAGIFNLADETRARNASRVIQSAIDAQKGRFSGMVAGGSTNIIDRAAANVAWDVRGHYLMYCVIANANGSAISPDDSASRAIVHDIVEGFLGGDVIHKREIGKSQAPVASPQRS